MNFKDFWKINNGYEPFAKAKLTKAELADVQATIAKLQARGLPSSKIITALQKMNAKLSERWKAERAYWTETKRDDTEVVAEAGEALDIEEYKVILSPNACKTCREKTMNGAKVFKTTDLNKSGYGHVPPFHPNCYCITVPKG